MNHEHVEQFEVDGLTITIDYDTDAESSREWSNIGEMVCWHRRYNLGDKHEFDSPSDFQEWADSKESDVAIVLPLYLYDHSGITMSCSSFSCPWDSGQVGYIYITKAKIRDKYSVKRISKKLLERVRGYLVNEVETYDMFLTGQVYGYSIEDSEGNNVDSCWGFYGLDHCKEEATSAAKCESDAIAKRESEVAKLLDVGYAL
jgi:hypothetical protein